MHAADQARSSGTDPMTVERQQPAVEVERLVLEVAGMTCGSCAARVERVPSRQEGVTEAWVNFATSRAMVAFDRQVIDPASLVAAVERGGYHARRVTIARGPGCGADPAHAREIAG